MKIVSESSQLFNKVSATGGQGGKMRRVFLAVMTVIFVSSFANAQDLGSTLAKVARPYAQAYVAPAVNAFGMDMNSGLFHNASVGGALPFGLSLYVGVQMGGALVPSSDKTFNLTYHDTVGAPATYTVTNAPTIFGSKDKGTITVTPDNSPLSGTEPGVGGLVNTGLVPIPIPQVGLGSLFGTDVTVRWLPQIKIADYGKFQLFGWALRHSVSQYIPLIPVDIAVQLGFQNFSIKDSAGGNVFKLSTFAANVEVSKTFAILTVYGGLQVESSKVDVNYIFTPSPTLFDPTPTSIPIAFSQNGKNKFRALLGLDLGLGPLTINADYSIGAVNAATAGLGVTI
jgi:Family of unknown function (DUF6588)